MTGLSQNASLEGIDTGFVDGVFWLTCNNSPRGEDAGLLLLGVKPFIRRLSEVATYVSSILGKNDISQADFLNKHLHHCNLHHRV